MRLQFSRFILMLALGVLMGHNLMPHHHHESGQVVFHEEDPCGSEATAHHHDHDHESHPVPDHHVDEVYFVQGQSDLIKAAIDNAPIAECLSLILPAAPEISSPRLIPQRIYPPEDPLLQACSLRGPPAA